MNEQAVAGQINPIFGQIGHLFVIVAFVCSIAAFISYFISFRSALDVEKHKWKKTARILFLIHAVSVFGIVVTLFTMIFNHHFEYQYVWAHSSLDLRKKYILSCFWEGQEGSFLLWSFWHVVLGLIVMCTAKKWETSVMMIIASMQAFLISFLTGIYFNNHFHVGNSPFLLLQDALTQDPVFLFKNYMQFIPDGTGLNALLQNYWMVIHPPVLFLGFASVTVPFAYSFAGLIQKDYTGWIKPALPFALFSGMVLGTGILMGGAWAYESLSFGGFWAWDPVENASMIPWLVMVAALHAMVISKSTGNALKTTFVLLFLSFFFVLYASFLTRSGILGDTSVHSFVAEGLENHLLIFLFTYTIVGLFFLFKNWNQIPTVQKEEATSSREFWMFIGSLVLLFAGIHIIFFTSLPVWNVLFHEKWSLPTKPVQYYTSVQIWVAIIIALLVSVTQYLKYKKTTTKVFFKSISIAFLLAVIATALSAQVLDYPWFVGVTLFNIHLYNFYPNTLLLLAAFFAVIANAGYFITVLKGKIKVAGGSVAHVGFGILLLGILISNANQTVISKNTSGIDYGKDFDQKFKRENTLLYKNIPQNMGNYIVTYVSDSTNNGTNYYNIKYEKVDSKSGEIIQTFYLHPYLLLDKKSQQLTPNPDTKHYVTFDVFTHISSVPTEEAKNQPPVLKQDTVAAGDTIRLQAGFLVFQNFKSYPQLGDTLTASAILKSEYLNKINTVEPKVHIVGDQLYTESATIKDSKVDVAITNILPEENKIVIATSEPNAENDWVILKAIIFPMINLVWVGAITMAIGFFISLLRRYKENKIIKSITS